METYRWTAQTKLKLKMMTSSKRKSEWPNLVQRTCPWELQGWRKYSRQVFAATWPLWTTWALDLRQVNALLFSAWMVLAKPLCSSHLPMILCQLVAVFLLAAGMSRDGLALPENESATVLSTTASLSSCQWSRTCISLLGLRASSGRSEKVWWIALLRKWI